MDKLLFTIKGIRPLMLILGCLSLLQTTAIILQATGLAKAVSMLFQGQPLAEAAKSLALFAAAFILRHTFAWVEQVLAGRFAESTSEHYRLKLAEDLFDLGPGYTATNGSGKLITLAMDGIQRFRTYLELSVPRTIDMMLMTFPLLVMIYVLDLTSGLILTFTMPVLIVFFILLGFAARKLADKQWRSYQVLANHFTDALRGLETLRFLGRSSAYAGTVEDVSDRYRSATMRTLRVAFLSSFALDFFSTLSVAFVAVGLGLRLIGGGIGLEAALTVLLLAPEYFTPVRMLGTDYHASLDGKEAFHSIRQVAEATEQKKYAEQEAHADQLTACDTISLDHIYVSSDEGMAQLTDIHAALGADIRKIGIVGMSGAGKTTLLNTLSGFLQPTSGTITIGGSPLTEQTKRMWQQHIAYIPQQPYVFSATLADNVRFYEPEATDDQVRQALSAVKLEELVHQLPEGLYERIGEGGRALSGGQAHRIALARALVGHRSVWLLDEPTAHLDIETELELKETMLSLFGQRCIFLATHRLHWMKDMDWIWVLKDGKLIEAGSHDELTDRQGLYWELLSIASDGGKRHEG